MNIELGLFSLCVKDLNKLDNHIKKMLQISIYSLYSYFLFTMWFY